ncbi:MAG TPA: hypothetical protein VER35_03145 [Candidatus Limnocylindrales bacterium]|nr:hypothetical protein [Candidatus Limnocylindrales bacterium]
MDEEDSESGEDTYGVVLVDSDYQGLKQSYLIRSNPIGHLLDNNKDLIKNWLRKSDL